ncbi:PLP-dependent aminotransferase family protein [Achromobacter kerstersii]|uniref:MocR-like pyridoxine biosynthesis transcription factor PdxR n=1 Tax=Achromobacter kerstersii TaxID=1353890 RepID=UPI003CFDC6EE
MLRHWNFTLTLDRKLATALHQQIAQAIVDKIRAGLLRPGEVLPGTRELSEYLSVNRKTVVLAYEELVAQGWLAAQGKRGTFVSPDIPQLRLESKAEANLAMANANGLPGPDYAVYGVERALPVQAKRGFIEFTDGVPDTRVISFGALSSAFRHALVELARGNQLGYGDPRGDLALRQHLAHMLRSERGLNADPDTICLVRGSQMGIYLAARVLVRPGDVVALEKLTYPPARDAFRACGATVLGIDQDEDGLIPDSVERLCRRYKLKAIYITPHHQFPTTVTMPPARRLRLLALAEQFGFAIVEDDYDHEFHFAHTPLLPVASVDRWGKVLYVGSLSKVLAPGLRIGYVVAPKSIINRIANEVMLIDRQGNAITERAAAELFANGELKRHIRRAVRIYDDRRGAASKLIKSKLGAVASYREPEGGLAFWLRLDSRIDMPLLAKDAHEEQVSFLDGSTFSDNQSPIHGIRLGYGSLDEREFGVGIDRLRSALHRQKLAGGAA